MRLSDFVLVWLSNAKRECDSGGKTEAINKYRGVEVQAQPGSSGWVGPHAAPQTPLGSSGIEKLIQS